jgi:phage-related minor tail protein
MSAMSNLLTPVDLNALEAVTGGTATTPRSSSSSNDQLLQTLTGIANTIKDIGTTANKTGFSTTEVLMLGLLMNQNRGGQVNVFVRRPYW